MAGKVTPSGLNLLKRMLEYDPEKRIKAEEALDHEYFKESPVVTTKCVPAARGSLKTAQWASHARPCPCCHVRPLAAHSPCRRGCAATRSAP